MNVFKALVDRWIFPPKRPNMIELQARRQAEEQRSITTFHKVVSELNKFGNELRNHQIL